MRRRQVLHQAVPDELSAAVRSGAQHGLEMREHPPDLGGTQVLGEWSKGDLDR